MNAFQPSRPPLEPIQKRRVTPRKSRHLRQRSYQVMALETTVKIGVNVVISVAAASALVQLLPYHWLQQDKLREIGTEVRFMEGRVNTLNTKFSQNFDPRENKTIMQQQSYRFDPNQRQVVIMNKDGSEAEQ